ncbi:MAG: hypothetical protein AAFU77_03915 [Myxococcota bacterium]
MGRWIAVALAVSVPGPAWAVVVEATGVAELGDDGLLAAENEALNRALTRALEKVVGVTVQSKFSLEMREVVKDNKDRFDADIRDQVLKNTEGFIADYEVLEKRKMLPRVQVRVRADVYESKVEAELEKLAELIVAAGNPRVMVVVQEIVREPNGKERVDETGQLGAIMERALKEEGFVIQGATRASELSQRSAKQFKSFAKNIANAVDIAREEGADFLIAGRIVLTNRGKLGDSAPMPVFANKVKVEVEANLQAMIVATGEVLSPAPVMSSELGANFERAKFRVYKGSKGKGFNVVEKVLGKILPDVRTRLKKIAEDGRSWMVELSGIKNFRSQGRAFVKVVDGVSGVSSTRETSFEGGKLRLEVECKCTVNELRDRIFDRAEQVEALTSLDLKATGSGRLAFGL